METKQKECEICGVWFTPSRSSQKYCPECGKDSTKAWRDLHKHMQYSVARVGTGRPVSKNRGRMQILPQNIHLLQWGDLCILQQSL